MAARNPKQPNSPNRRMQDVQGRSWNQSMASPSDPQQPQSIGSGTAFTSPSPVPIATSTPRATSTPVEPILTPYTRSERQAEDDLFQRIERLIRDFLCRPNRRYPYHRIMEWTQTDDVTRIYSAVVVINPPSTVVD